MLLYDIRTAFKSLRRNPVLSALLVGAIALGICVSTTFIALRHVFERDPLPGRSRTLFNVRLDNWDPQRAYVAEDPKSLPSQVTYRDARGLMQSKIPTRQGATTTSRMFVFPDPKVGRPFSENVRLAFSDFFPMFDIPFEYGGPWSKADEAKPEQVVVIDHAMNQKLFGGRNSVGQQVRIDDRHYKVVGVISGKWKPSYRFYDLTQGLNQPESIFMPFNFIPVLELYPGGNTDGWTSNGNTHAEFLQAEQVWIQFWAELPATAQQQAYRAFT
ncbi:MAG TPA: ABC transporter permease, partial [Thermoanaerobaculia bacterium]|nr:ABC transporter permease [Thermoanaerobaculia bacterium]